MNFIQKILRSTIAIGSTVCGVATAQESQAVLDHVLVHEDGMTQVTNGLYARIVDGSESYVAVGKSGQAALLERVVDLRARLVHTQASGHSINTERLSLDVVSRAIADLSQPQPKNQTVTGDCSGPGGGNQPQLYARALSSYGLNTSAYAVLTSDFGPVTWTVNYASSGTENGLGVTTSSQTSTQNAYTAASASAAAPNGNTACTASSYASVKCPGQTSPAISAFAFSQKSVGCVL